MESLTPPSGRRGARRPSTAFQLRWLLLPALIVNGWTIWMGMTVDAITISKTLTKSILWFRLRLVDERQSLSVIEAIFRLRDDGSYFLFVVLFAFSVLFPICKWIGNSLLALHVLFSGSSGSSGMRRASDLLAVVGRWSMLDVFVAALLCVFLKLGDVTRVRIEAGMYFFLAAVFLGMANARWTHMLLAPRRSD